MNKFNQSYNCRFTVCEKVRCLKAFPKFIKISNILLARINGNVHLCSPVQIKYSYYILYGTYMVRNSLFNLTDATAIAQTHHSPMHYKPTICIH